MPPTRALLLYRELLGEHRTRLDRLIDRRGSARLKRMYEQAEADLIKKLAAQAGSRGATFTAHTHRLMLAQIRQGQAMIARRMAGELGDLTKEAQVESLRGLGRQVTKLEKAFTGVTTVLPIEEAATFQGIVRGRSTSLMRLHESSMARYGARLVGKMEGELSQSLMQGETMHEAIGRIEEVTGREWYAAERIVRTETAMAYSATSADGIAAISDSVGGMWMRWTEFVSDSTGDGLDDRVGIDSEAMHGQVAPPGGKFTQPPTSKSGKIVKGKIVGEDFEFPPNRPNDRATLAPWRPEWGVPGWQWIGGRRVPVKKIPDAGEFGGGVSALAEVAQGGR